MAMTKPFYILIFTSRHKRNDDSIKNDSKDIQTLTVIGTCSLSCKFYFAEVWPERYSSRLVSKDTYSWMVSGGVGWGGNHSTEDIERLIQAG